MLAFAIIVTLVVAWLEARRQQQYLRAPIMKHEPGTWDPYLDGKTLVINGVRHRREYGQLYCGHPNCYLDWVDGDLVHTVTQHHAATCIEARMRVAT